MNGIESLIYKIRLQISRALIRKHSSSSGAYYINGPDTLPPPLSPAEEETIINKLENDASARATLIEHNLRLVVYISKKFENCDTGLEDLISIGTIGLIKAVNTFRSDKNIKLATYASRCIENEILMYIRKTSQRRGDVSIDEPLNVDWDGNELLLSDVLGGDTDSVSRRMEQKEDETVILRALEDLDDRERKIVEMRFGMYGSREYTQKEVAEKMGISQSYISRLEKKIIKKLHEMVKDKIF